MECRGVHTAETLRNAAELTPDFHEVLVSGTRQGNFFDFRARCIFRRDFRLRRHGRYRRRDRDTVLCDILQALLKARNPREQRIAVGVHLRFRKPSQRELRERPFIGRIAKLLGQLRLHADCPEQHGLIREFRIRAEQLQALARAVHKSLGVFRRL